jgi:hypothetical protein
MKIELDRSKAEVTRLKEEGAKQRQEIDRLRS